MEMPRIELGASYMQSMRSTTELHPLLIDKFALCNFFPPNSLAFTLRRKFVY